MNMMREKLLFWITVVLLVLIVYAWQWEIAWVMVVVLSIVALAIGELYSQRKADKEYMRDPEAALLIGRCSEGIDHNGKRTRKIIK